MEWILFWKIKQRESRNCSRHIHSYLSIIIGIISAIFIRIFVSTSLSPDICRWVYSTIIQAFAAMVALVGMFTVYKLQLLANKHKDDITELTSAVKDHEEKKMLYDNVLVERTKKSLDFINDEKAIENERKAMVDDEKFIEDRMQKIHKGYKEKTNGRGSRTIELGPADAKELIKLSGWRWAVEDEKRILDRVQRKKDDATYTKRTLKIPLVASGCLIGISFFLLSLSTESIIHSAQSLFLWCFAGITGAAVCLTYMLIRVILILIEI